jgi:hypothetical protein
MMKEAIYGFYAAWYRMNGDPKQKIPWTFRGSCLPQELENLPDSADDYDPKDMKLLYDEGFKWGLENDWIPGLPAPDYGCSKP